MKVDDILMVIIGLLSLIIFYKIFKGSLIEGVEGPPPPKYCDSTDPKSRCPGNIDCDTSKLNCAGNSRKCECPSIITDKKCDERCDEQCAKKRKRALK